MLELAARGRLQLREERLALPRARLLYVSDLHLTPWHGHVVEQVLEKVRQTSPDLVLLGGDLVDLSGGLPLLKELIRRLPAPFAAVPGNHDQMVGLASVEAALGQNWLTRHRLGELTLDGVLHEDVPPNSILCAHSPAVFPRAAAAGYRLVLAGHLHGSQFVLGQKDGLLYPGAWFYRWNGDRFQQRSCTMLVSRGVNDTLPVRWNCPRDVICCHLEGP